MLSDLIDHSELSVCVLTASGRGAVATLGLEGDLNRLDAEGHFRAANGRRIGCQSLNAVVFGRWGTNPAEEVVLCRLSDRECELHCHGGPAATGRILLDLQATGARVLHWVPFRELQQGFFERHLAESLAKAATARTAEFILHQADGPFANALKTLQDAVEVRNADGILDLIGRLQPWRKFVSHLSVPWDVFIVGPPNVGKSQLMNALLGFERSIVFDRPGTTRDLVTAETAFEGWPMRLTDTAGMRKTDEELESAGILRALQQRESAAVAILVLDGSVPPTAEERKLLESPHEILVMNKADLPKAWGDAVPQEAFALSALKAERIEPLIARIVELCVGCVPSPEMQVPFHSGQYEFLDDLAKSVRRGEWEMSEALLQGYLEPPRR